MKLRDDTTPKVRVDYDEYLKFVSAVTSKESSDYDAFVARFAELKDQVDLNRLLTAAIGVGAEGGEFAEIVKKITFQGKPYDDASREHMIVELGDVLWYIAQACMSLGVSFDDLVIRNVQKLEARYPEGAFEVVRSENRRAGDI
jgi:NTP pyrophosphatase (non-canonical NTP hydrolase)